MTALIVMGPSGAGKSSIGIRLAAALGIEFIDADDLHSPRNVATMAAGQSLTDEDRYPWLETVGCTVRDADSGIVVACSALRREYRDRIRGSAPDVIFVELRGSRELLSSRMRGRDDHFMPIELLDSQLATLESLEPDEPGFAVSITPAPEVIIESILRELMVRHRGGRKI